MESYTQLGLAGITLGILFFTVRYFVKALTEKDITNKELTSKFMKMIELNIKSHNKLSKSIDLNTEITKKSADCIVKLANQVTNSK